LEDFAMKYRTSWTVPAPLEKVAAAFCSEAYNVEEAISREDVKSASFKRIATEASQNQFEIHYIEYRRTKMGKLDKSGTARAVTESVYRDKDRTLRWVYKGPEKRVSIAGTYRLEPAGEQTRVFHETDIDVRIPVVGGRIAKVIAKEFGKAMPRVQRILERHATGGGGA
jgi:hypothetical protein